MSIVSKVCVVVALMVGPLEQSAAAWQFMFCNETNEPVSVRASFPYCGLSTEPKIDGLAPKACVVIDNSNSTAAACWIDNVRFRVPGTNEILAQRNKRHWADTSFIFKKSNSDKDKKAYTIEARASGGVVYDVPEGSRIVAVLENSAKLVFQKLWSGGLKGGGTSAKPNQVLLDGVIDYLSPSGPSLNLQGDIGGPAVLVVGGVIVGTVALVAIPVAAYDFLKVVFDSCFRHGKYIVWTTPGDAEISRSFFYRNERDEGKLWEQFESIYSFLWDQSAPKERSSLELKLAPKSDLMVVAPSGVCGYALAKNLQSKFPSLVPTPFGQYEANQIAARKNQKRAQKQIAATCEETEKKNKQSEAQRIKKEIDKLLPSAIRNLPADRKRAVEWYDAGVLLRTMLFLKDGEEKEKLKRENYLKTWDIDIFAQIGEQYRPPEGSYKDSCYDCVLADGSSNDQERTLMCRCWVIRKKCYAYTKLEGVVTNSPEDQIVNFNGQLYWANKVPR